MSPSASSGLLRKCTRAKLGKPGKMDVHHLIYLHLYSPPASCVVRDASGNMTDILPGNITDGCVGLACNFGWNFTECTLTQSCEFGLANSSKVQLSQEGIKI